MKHINLIFSVLFWAVSSVCMAVTLPSASYIGSTEDVDFDASYRTISVGSSSIIGTYLGVSSVSYGGECSETEPVSDARKVCCMGQLSTEFGMSLTDCAKTGNNDCLNYWQDCLESTSLPLGSPLLLLPFLAIYAVIRKRKENTMA